MTSPNAPPRGPGELAEIEAIIRKHVRCQWSGEPFEGVTFVILGQAEAAAEIAALRAPQGDGAEAMREVIARWHDEVADDRARRTVLIGNSRPGSDAHALMDRERMIHRDSARAVRSMPLPALGQHSLTKNSTSPHSNKSEV